jgi:hypothetical protein
MSAGFLEGLDSFLDMVSFSDSKCNGANVADCFNFIR